MLLDFVKDMYGILSSQSNSEAQGAYAYTQERGWKQSTIDKHLIGFCPSDYEIPDEIKFYGNNEEREEGDTDRRCYEYFIHGKIIVPVFEEFGECVGFATRSPTFESGHTWWNLPKPFHKGNHLYLLNETRKPIFDANKVYLVEGYADTLMLHQEGISNVCGLMGTALTTRKIGLIARYCNNICLCLDVDQNESGQKAQSKAIHILHEFRVCESISVIDGMPVGDDPDVFIRNHGIDEFKNIERKLTDIEVQDICRKVIQDSKGNS